MNLSDVDYSTFNNNTIYQAGQSGILLPVGATYNTIMGNVITNSSYVQAGYSGISLSGGFNTVIGNICTDNQTPATQTYGIEIATDNNQIVMGNTCLGNLSGEITGGLTTGILEHNQTS
jgi:hypothetical protein